jgi:F-type H+-transporting ATPase subunit epsilon
MFLEIITPDRQVFSGEVSSATFPGADGSFQVLNQHAPLISLLAKGIMKAISSGKEQTWNVEGGLVEVLDNKILVLAETINSEAFLPTQPDMP